MKLAFVIQRYGVEVNGGAELHCRWLAEKLAEDHHVAVLTTCALDYVHWANHYSEGKAIVNGIPVYRYPVRKKRNERVFARISNLVFFDSHTQADEIEWIKTNGPFSPKLIKAIKQQKQLFDLFIFYCFRYYQTYHGLTEVADKSILVPTAEDDPAVTMRIYKPFFLLPKGILYLTPEEQQLVADATGNHSVLSAVIGSGVNVPRGTITDNRARYGIEGKMVLYVGRIDRNKGCPQLFSYFKKYLEEVDPTVTLVLVGNPVIPIPEHPRIKHLGFVSEETKYELLASCDVLVVPSPYESLSVILLEAWAMSKAALVNGRCTVLKGQCLRSNGGLFYHGYAEFTESLRLLLSAPDIRLRLGAQGKRYVETEYSWDLIKTKCNTLFKQIAGAAHDS